MTTGPWDLDWYINIWLTCSECANGRCYLDGDGEHYACDRCGVLL